MECVRETRKWRFGRHFRFVEPLGRGGMGAVFKAEDPRGNVVAVKVVRGDVGGGGLSGRFGHERALATFIGTVARRRSEPAEFVQVHDSPVPMEVAPNLVMEYVAWPTLRGLLRERRRERDAALPLETALRVGTALLHALGQLHNFNVVHCDVKPDNLFVDPDNLFADPPPDDSGVHLRLADFGVWTVSARSGQGTIPGVLAGSIVGTPPYMPPEQFGVIQIDSRADLHSAASVIWELAAGRPPFDLIPEQHGEIRGDRNWCERRRHALRQVPARPPAMPEDLYGVLSKALAYDPADRFADAAEMSDAISAVLAGVRKAALLRERMKRLDGRVARLRRLRDAAEDGLRSAAVLVPERMSAHEKEVDSAEDELVRCLKPLPAPGRGRAGSAGGPLDRFLGSPGSPAQPAPVGPAATAMAPGNPQPPGGRPRRAAIAAVVAGAIGAASAVGVGLLASRHSSGDADRRGAAAVEKDFRAAPAGVSAAAASQPAKPGSALRGSSVPGPQDGAGLENRSEKSRPDSPRAESDRQRRASGNGGKTAAPEVPAGDAAPRSRQAAREALFEPCSEGRFAAAGQQVVDCRDRLVWQKTPPSQGLAWVQAGAYCAGLSGGWRLPTVEELGGLLDKCGGSPTIDHEAFPDAPAAPFWTSSVDAGHPGRAWLVSFSIGTFTRNEKSGQYRVRCVR